MSAPLPPMQRREVRLPDGRRLWLYDLPGAGEPQVHDPAPGVPGAAPGAPPATPPKGKD